MKDIDIYANFFNIPSLKAPITIQKKVYFPNLFEKMITKTKIINNHKIYSKSAIFKDFRVNLGDHCGLIFDKDFKMFFKMNKDERNQLDCQLESFAGIQENLIKRGKSNIFNKNEFGVLFFRIILKSKVIYSYFR